MNNIALSVLEPPNGRFCASITYCLVWSKSDQRRLRKTLHKPTNKQTDKPTDTTRITVTWPWTNTCACYALVCQFFCELWLTFHKMGVLWTRMVSSSKTFTGHITFGKAAITWYFRRSVPHLVGDLICSDAWRKLSQSFIDRSLSESVNLKCVVQQNGGHVRQTRIQMKCWRLCSRFVSHNVWFLTKETEFVFRHVELLWYYKVDESSVGRWTYVQNRTALTYTKQELIRRWDSERELFLQHRTCRGQRLRPLNEFVISTKHLRYLPTHPSNRLLEWTRPSNPLRTTEL